MAQNVLNLKDLYRIQSLAHDKYVGYPNRPTLNSVESLKLSTKDAQALAYYEASIAFLRSVGYQIVPPDTDPNKLEPVIVDQYRSF